MDYTLTYVYIPIHKLGSDLNIIFYIFKCYLFLYAMNFDLLTEMFTLMKVIIYITKQSIYIISYGISNDTTHMIH